MAARRVLHRDGLPDLFFSLHGFTGYVAVEEAGVAGQI
jgi:hypothetical protein